MDYFSAALAFVRASELGSFSKAARELGVKTSTVSRHIGELEQDMGIALFNRSTRGLVLTEGGHAFLQHVPAALNAMAEARAATAELNQRPKGRLRVSLPPAFAHRFVLPALPAFLQQFPEISVEMQLIEETVNLIGAGIDLAIRTGELQDSGLMARRLAPHGWVLCAHGDYLAANGSPDHPLALKEHTCLPVTRETPESWTLQRDSEQVTIRPQGRLSSNDLEALHQMAQSATGIARLPLWMVASSFADGRLQRVLTDWEVISGSGDSAIWAVFPPKRTVSSKVRAFVDFYANYLRVNLGD